MLIILISTNKNTNYDFNSNNYQVSSPNEKKSIMYGLNTNKCYHLLKSKRLSESINNANSNYENASNLCGDCCRKLKKNYREEIKSYKRSESMSSNMNNNNINTNKARNISNVENGGKEKIRNSNMKNYQY